VADITITNVSRSFGSVAAVSSISLEIKAGEFFTLLGPSGCGKTTLLRMIAGFADLDGGQISIGGRRIDRLPPHRRNIGMVFQNYAIFPNLTVASELSSTVVLYSGPWRTLTIVMFQALEGTGAGIAVAAASILIAVSLIPVMLAYRLLRRYELSML